MYSLTFGQGTSQTPPASTEGPPPAVTEQGGVTYHLFTDDEVRELRREQIDLDAAEAKIKEYEKLIALANSYTEALQLIAARQKQIIDQDQALIAAQRRQIEIADKIVKPSFFRRFGTTIAHAVPVIAAGLIVGVLLR